MVENKNIWRLPYTKQEIRTNLELYSIFQGGAKINQLQFVKEYFPSQAGATANEKKSQASALEADNYIDELPDLSKFTAADREANPERYKSYLVRKYKFTKELHDLETLLKQKLSNNFNHVRNAFLFLDADQDGFITAMDVAKYLKNTKLVSI